MVSGSGVCAKQVVVDARHHMLGRLASIVAKELLNGQKVVSTQPRGRTHGRKATRRLPYVRSTHCPGRQSALF